MANKSIENLKVTKIRQFKVPCKSGITENTFCPNGDMVFVAYTPGNRLLIIDSMGNFRRDISLPSIQPSGVTSIDDNTVAVTTWCQKDIYDVDIDLGIIKAQISGDFFGGLTRTGNTLICCDRSNKLKAVDLLLDSTVSTLIAGVPIDQQSYVATSSNKIFVTNCIYNTVSCYNINGGKEWQFDGKSLVKTPFGITVDRYNNVYVSSNVEASVMFNNTRWQTSKKNS